MATAIDFKALLAKQKKSRQQQQPTKLPVGKGFAMKDVKDSLASYLLPGPPSCYYIPEFVTEQDERAIINQARSFQQCNNYH